MITLLHHLFEDCICGLTIVVKDRAGHPHLHLIHGTHQFLPGITPLLNPSLHQLTSFGFPDNIEDKCDATIVKLIASMISLVREVQVELLEQHKAVGDRCSRWHPPSISTRGYRCWIWAHQGLENDVCSIPHHICLTQEKYLGLPDIPWHECFSGETLRPDLFLPPIRFFANCYRRISQYAFHTMTCILLGQKAEWIHEGLSTLPKLAFSQPKYGSHWSSWWPISSKTGPAYWCSVQGQRF